MTDLFQLDITELAPRLRKREVSAVEVTDAYLARIERLNPLINAYITVMADQARQAARKVDAEIGSGKYRGPLHGVPIGIKDLFDVAGVPNTMGTKILRDNVPQTDATHAARPKDAGAIVHGKQHLHESSSR